MNDQPPARLNPDDSHLRSVIALRDRTSAIHTQAERAGIVADIVRKRGSRDGYALFLRNLMPAYEALEAGLHRHSATRGVGSIFRPGLARAGALARDVAYLAGPDWSALLPLTPAAARYAQRIESVAQQDGAGLIAHAYVRYFGDLSGGQIVKKVIEDSFAPGPQAMNFYQFDAIDDVAAFKRDYRAAFDAAMQSVDDPAFVLDEAVTAFELNISLSVEVQACAAARAAGR